MCGKIKSILLDADQKILLLAAMVSLTDLAKHRDVFVTQLDRSCNLTHAFVCLV